MDRQQEFPSLPIGRSATAGLVVAYLALSVIWTEVVVGAPGPAALISPASGAALALVLLRGVGVWPVIFVAAIAHLVMSNPGAVVASVGEAVTTAIAAALEPLIAALLIWRLTGENYARRAGPFLRAMLIAAPIGAGAASVVAVIWQLPIPMTADPALGVLGAWYSMALAHVMGMIAVAPALWIWAGDPRLRIEPRQAVELSVLIAAVVAVLAMPTAAQARYLLVAIHIAIALRFPLRWSAAALALTSLMYLVVGTVELQQLPFDWWNRIFLGHVAFLIILNVATYVTALLHREIRERAAEMAGLAHALSEAEDTERRRIAEVIHDHLQQFLVAAKLALGGISEPGVDRARTRIDEAIEASRNLMAELHPPALDEGLPTGLEWLGQHVQELTGLEVRVQTDPNAVPESSEVQAFLFQAARELLLNVVKHAGTDVADLRLRRDGDAIVVEIQDYGKGCDALQAFRPRTTARHYGLPAIRQRLSLLGGRLDLNGEDGCRVTLVAPAARTERAES